MTRTGRRASMQIRGDADNPRKSGGGHGIALLIRSDFDALWILYKDGDMDPIITITATITSLLVIAGVVVALAAVHPRRRMAASGRRALQGASGEPEFLTRLPYTRAPHMLAGDHRALFAALNAAAPDDLAVLPHVRLSNILHVEAHTTQPERYQERIRDSMLDFVLCDAQTTSPRLAVLFVQPGAARRTAFIDAALVGAGVPVLRLNRSDLPSVEALATQIAALLGLPVRPAVAPLEHAVLHCGAAPLLRQDGFVVARTPVRYACGRCHRDISAHARRCPHCGATLAG